MHMRHTKPGVTNDDPLKRCQVNDITAGSDEALPFTAGGTQHRLGLIYLLATSWVRFRLDEAPNHVTSALLPSITFTFWLPDVWSTVQMEHAASLHSNGTSPLSFTPNELHLMNILKTFCKKAFFFLFKKKNHPVLIN